MDSAEEIMRKRYNTIRERKIQKFKGHVDTGKTFEEREITVNGRIESTFQSFDMIFLPLIKEISAL